MSLPPGVASAATPPTVPVRNRSLISRILPHLVWESVLLLLTIIALIVLWVRGEPALTGPNLYYTITALGLLSSGLALSLRTATPNLAVGGIAGLSGVVYALLLEQDWPAFVSASVAVLAVTVLGFGLGLVTGLTSAPGWTVSLGGLAATTMFVLLATDSGGPRTAPTAATPTAAGAVLWLLFFVLVSVGGGLLWLIPAVRRTLGADRAAAGRPGWSPQRLLGALVGLTGSSLLAGLSGIVAVDLYRAAIFGGQEIGRLLLALAIVLVAGVSAAGRRGPIVGTVLATVLVVVVSTIGSVEGATAWFTVGLLPALAILIGVVVNRLMEALSGPDDDRIDGGARTS